MKEEGFPCPNKKIKNWQIKDHFHHLAKNPLLFLGWNLIGFNCISHKGDVIAVEKWETNLEIPR